jgi:hypothetical protein
MRGEWKVELVVALVLILLVALGVFTWAATRA